MPTTVVAAGLVDPVQVTVFPVRLRPQLHALTGTWSVPGMIGM
ncbi:hypothetical protein WKI71_39370 [Streptomyces sp. MS1.AVA.1]|uniref:Uncharacterized protein n=1 Tax=Streptomyces machairae TaxID=3134109 RepID=A0ABU8UTJ0_9ACTN